MQPLPTRSGAPGAAPSPDERVWGARAARVIPGGASTGSKRAAALYGRDEPAAPTHFVRAAGCRIVTAGGRELIDFTMSLGAVALGYADAGVTRAVQDAAAAGNVAGLSPVREVELAERLCTVIPCAEQVRFLKSGAEGVAAAVRVARTFTGRDLVIGSGYFGWLDWWSSAAGVPAGACADFRALPFDDVAALEAAVDAAGDRLAAIVLEPVCEQLPSAAWLERARALCTRAGAVLVFDEVKTGCRLHTGGYQAVVGVVPDLAVFGKALANGFPLAALVGRASVMDAAQRTWISSTLAAESVALAAAWAVLDRHDATDVCTQLWQAGERQLQAVRRALAAAPAGDVTLHGVPAMWFLSYAHAARESRVLEALAADGVLLKRGAYNFPSLAHDAASTSLLEQTLAAALHATGASS